MYLDNVIKSAQAASMPEITYSEIVEDTLRMVEVEGAGQMALLKAEASAHILGSEAPSDWWVKIKTVARKIFEMLKNLITKVFAFIKSVPTKVGTLITRLLTKWEKLGMKSKVERIYKKDGSSRIRFNTAQDVRDRDFGPLFAAYTGAFNDAKGGEVNTALKDWGKACDQYMTAVANLSKEDNDRLEEQTQAEKEKVIAAENKYKDAVQKFKDAEFKPFETIFQSGRLVKEDDKVPSALTQLITDGWGILKNKQVEKKAQTEIRDQENSTRNAASAYRKLMATYERCTRDEDEQGVRNALDAAKNLRSVIAGTSRIAAQLGSFYYKDALVIARVVNAAISCCKGGETNSDKTFH